MFLLAINTHRALRGAIAGHPMKIILTKRCRRKARREMRAIRCAAIRKFGHSDVSSYLNRLVRWYF